MASQKDSVYTKVDCSLFSLIELIAAAVRIKVVVYETVLSCSFKLSMLALTNLFEQY